ncbi:hypothetical protein DPMN_147571 [Dreissena polymorpha]|uniref:Uncharacterized protein n=1 Tax=Dreissena polymorpha TaxID=45954 RepID=A0A9D4FDY5_DREPO|nr:hypothetical protein DPMN_147571 [Dreissena polymorpha]
MADQLKTQFEVMFFYIAFGSNDDTTGHRVMEEMSSKVEGENFFSAIDSKNDMAAEG